MSSPPTQLVSGEGVAFELNHAGIGSRLVAAAIDLALQTVTLVVVLTLSATVFGGADAAAVAAIVITEVVLVVAGYPILMEWLARGRTLGKMALGLRVVRDDGGPIGFRQALVRGVSGLVLEKPGLLAPFTTVVGVLTMIFSAREKRLGDMMAGTFVLNERAGPRRALAAQDFAVPYHLQHWAVALDLNRLDDMLALAVRQFVMRANEMTPAAQFALGEDLRARVESVIAPPPPPRTPTPWVLITVLAERRRRAELAMPVRAPVYSPVPPPAPGYLAGYPGQSAWAPAGAKPQPTPPVGPASPDPGNPFAPPR